jgi:hypothetical protein
MKRRFVTLGLVILVVAIIASALVYLTWQNGRPPSIVLTYQGNSYSGVLESSCWPNPPENGTCQLPVNLGRTDIPPPIPVRGNTSIAFQVVGYPDQSRFTVEIWTRANDAASTVAVEHISGSMPISLAAGDYYFTSSTTWSDGRAVAYTYEIQVS